MKLTTDCLIDVLIQFSHSVRLSQTCASQAVIRIQKVLRGHFARKMLNKSKEDGIGAIEMAVKNAVRTSMEEANFYHHVADPLIADRMSSPHG